MSARARLTPVKPAPAGSKDFADDLRDRLAAGPLVYELALQFFIDEQATPIEDPTVAWPEDRAPPLVVARLTLKAVEPDVEGLRFDPWGGLADHRPLGEIMRARKAAYFHSSEGARRAVNGLTRWSGGGHGGARLRRIAALQVTIYCNSKMPIPAREEVTARPFARANH